MTYCFLSVIDLGFLKPKANFLIGPYIIMHIPTSEGFQPQTLAISTNKLLFLISCQTVGKLLSRHRAMQYFEIVYKDDSNINADDSDIQKSLIKFFEA